MEKTGIAPLRECQPGNMSLSVDFGCHSSNNLPKWPFQQIIP